MVSSSQRGTTFSEWKGCSSPANQAVSLAELYPVLLLNNEITSSQAES